MILVPDPDVIELIDGRFTDLAALTRPQRADRIAVSQRQVTVTIGVKQLPDRPGRFKATYLVKWHAVDDPNQPGPFRVTWARTSAQPQRHISSIGGVTETGAAWALSRADAVAAIERGEIFYVERPAGDRVNLEVARGASGWKYVKTVADGHIPNNLLSLPETPITAIARSPRTRLRERPTAETE
jgi:hypothetical protein